MKVKKYKAINEAPAKKNLGDIASDAVGPGVDQEIIKSTIEEALDMCLDRADEQNASGLKEWVNLLLIGIAGVGKTAVVESWSARNGINLVKWNTSTMNEDDLMGLLRADDKTGTTFRTASELLNPLMVDDTVLFLDEFNRGNIKVRGALLTLINNHEVPAGTRQNGGKATVKLNKLLFVVAAQNPFNELYKGTDALDQAEASRFMIIEVSASKSSTLDYLNRVLDRNIKTFESMLNNKDFSKPYIISDDVGNTTEVVLPQRRQNAETVERYLKYNKGRKNLINTLLTSKNFQFDTIATEYSAYEKTLGKVSEFINCSPRSVTRLLFATDGTKDSFLDNWDRFCNPEKKRDAIVALDNFQDDPSLKANSVFAAGKEKPKSNLDKINDYLNL